MPIAFGREISYDLTLYYDVNGGKMIQIDFDKMGGLIPAIIQDHVSGEVLMVAFMDKKTLDLTLESGKTWFFSRTRNKYWMKGEESGNTQEVDGGADRLRCRHRGDQGEAERPCRMPYR